MKIYTMLSSNQRNVSSVHDELQITQDRTLWNIVPPSGRLEHWKEGIVIYVLMSR